METVAQIHVGKQLANRIRHKESMNPLPTLTQMAVLRVVESDGHAGLSGEIVRSVPTASRTQPTKSLACSSGVLPRQPRSAKANASGSADGIPSRLIPM